MVEKLKSIISFLFQDRNAPSGTSSEQQEFTPEEWAAICEEASEMTTIFGMTMDQSIHAVINSRRSDEHLRALLISRKKNN